MSSKLQLQKTYTFTIKSRPHRDAVRDTLRRLMQMQPDVQKGLRRLSRRRRQVHNITRTRAGVDWTNRVKATKLVHIDRGQTFTLRVSPKIMADLASIERYVDAVPA